MNHFYFTASSVNKKTGPMPVVSISRNSCPPSCPLMGKGCYADLGPMNMLWNKLDKVGLTLKELCKRLKSLYKDQVWRYAQMGDLPGEGETIDADDLDSLVTANAGRPVIAFTHKYKSEENIRLIGQATERGFHINLSANSPIEADDLLETGLSVVTVGPIEYQRQPKEDLTTYKKRLRDLPRTTPKGTPLAVCPATYTDTTCLQCRACAKPRKRNAVMLFPAHGTRKRMADELARNGASSSA